MKIKSLLFCFCAVILAFVTGCATSKGGLSKEALNNVPTKLWYDNANLLVKANKPDLKADAFTGVPALDAVVDTVKDIIVQVPNWLVARVEQKHFDNAYAECAKAVNSGKNGADVVIKGQAFKTALLMDTFAQEVAHAEAAVGASPEEKMKLYAQNKQVYEEAVKKVSDYAQNEVFAYESCLDDAKRQAFFTAESRADWNDGITDIAEKISDCIKKANAKDATKEDKKANKEAIAELCEEMGVQKMDWGEVSVLLAGDMQKLQQALTDFIQIIQNDSDLQGRIAKVALGGEIVSGVSGKETLAAINRFKDQAAVSIELIGWLISDLVH